MHLRGLKNIYINPEIKPYLYCNMTDSIPTYFFTELLAMSNSMSKANKSK